MIFINAHYVLLLADYMIMSLIFILKIEVKSKEGGAIPILDCSKLNKVSFSSMSSISAAMGEIETVQS